MADAESTRPHSVPEKHFGKIQESEEETSSGHIQHASLFSLSLKGSNLESRMLERWGAQNLTRACLQLSEILARNFVNINQLKIEVLKLDAKLIELYSIVMMSFIFFPGVRMHLIILQSSDKRRRIGKLSRCKQVENKGIKLHFPLPKPSLVKCTPGRCISIYILHPLRSIPVPKGSWMKLQKGTKKESLLVTLVLGLEILKDASNDVDVASYTL